MNQKKLTPIVYSSILSAFLLGWSSHSKGEEIAPVTIKRVVANSTCSDESTEPMGRAGDHLDYDLSTSYTNYKPCFFLHDFTHKSKIPDILKGKIDYIFVLMLENRSFDSYFGRLPAYLKKQLDARNADNKKNNRPLETDLRVNPVNLASDNFTIIGQDGIDVPGTPFYELTAKQQQLVKYASKNAKYANANTRNNAPYNFDTLDTTKSNRKKIYWQHHSYSQQANYAARYNKGMGGLCVSDTAHDWWAAQLQWNEGKMDGFVMSNQGYFEMGEPKANNKLLPNGKEITNRKTYNAMLQQGERAMLYYDERDIPFFYWLADNFAIGDRYFSSVLGPTWVNRDYLYGGTSRGLTSNLGDLSVLGDLPVIGGYPYNFAENQNPDPTPQEGWSYMGDTLINSTAAGIHYWISDNSWNDGKADAPKIGSWHGLKAFTESESYSRLNDWFGLYPNQTFVLLGKLNDAMEKESANLSLKKPQYQGYLKGVNLIDPDILEDVNGEDDHPPATPINGQKLVYKIVAALKNHPKIWERSVLFITYDEHGGFYDHVSPPQAVKPDNVAPKYTGPYAKEDATYNYDFDRYGVRVPFIVVSPWVKQRYVSHKTYDHTSILRFIEARWDLPALTDRDANADPMLDMFDFNKSYLKTALDSTTFSALDKFKVYDTLNGKTKKSITNKQNMDLYWKEADPANPTKWTPSICTATYFPPFVDTDTDPLTDPLGADVYPNNSAGISCNVFQGEAKKCTSSASASAPTSQYTKIANDSSALPNNAQLGSNSKDWACTLDNTTGLMWEIKTDDNTMRDRDWGYYGNDTYNYVTTINTQGLCGYKDWRLPNKDELDALFRENVGYLEDFDFTPLLSYSYWSSTFDERTTNGIWTVDAKSGTAITKPNQNFLTHVKLVRKAT